MTPSESIIGVGARDSGRRSRSRKFSWPSAVGAGSATITLAVVGVAIYWPILGDFFALDDYIWLHAAKNPDAAVFFRQAFSFPAGSLIDVPTPFWRPMVDTYFFVAWRIFGLDPLPYHITNLVLHICVALLAAVFVRQLTASSLAAISTGLIFVAMPTFDFAVTWISSVTELLAAFLYLLTLVAYTAYHGRGGRWMYAGALVAFLLALLTKESAATVPIVLAGIIVLAKPPLSREEVLQRMREMAPFVMLTLAYFIFLYVQEYRSGVDAGTYRFGWHAFGNYWDYLQWMTLPVSDDPASGVEAARPFTAGGFLVLGVAAIVLRMKVAGLAFLWTLLALMPYSFFPAGIEYRYTYLASIPFVIFPIGLVHAASTRIAIRSRTYPIRAMATVATAMLVVFFAIEARGRQEWISYQAAAYSELFEQVPVICGELPEGSFIYILSAPLRDLYGVSTGMALNLYYDDVFVNRPLEGKTPELAVFIRHKCTVRYVDGGYEAVPVE